MYTHVRPHARHFLNKEMLTFLQVGDLLSVRSSAGRLCSSQTASRVSSRHSWGSWRARPCRTPGPGRADATRWSRRARSSSAPGVTRAGRVAGGPVSSLRAENGAHGSATLPGARLLPACTWPGLALNSSEGSGVKLGCALHWGLPWLPADSPSEHGQHRMTQRQALRSGALLGHGVTTTYNSQK